MKELFHISFVREYPSMAVQFCWVYMVRFWYWESAEVASERTCQKLPPCWTDLVPDSSKKDPLLAKTEPISYAGSTLYVITYLRKRKKCWERGV